MPFEKTRLYSFNMPYALGLLQWKGRPCVVAATEDHGPIVVSPPPYTSAEVLVPGPGGCMSLISDPVRPGELYAIMGCFLGYNFHGGGVYRITDEGRSAGSKKIIDLPFAHRMEFIERGGVRSLVLANLAASKDNPADWARPGTVFTFPLGDPERQDWKGTPLLKGIHKNHGIFHGRLNGRSTLWISGQEGVFFLDLDNPSPEAPFEKVLDHEVSEIAVFDLDGDGQDELVTIEPFHGNVLAVYKPAQGSWNRVWEAELDYGHCVLAGAFLGKPSIVVSNRAGSKDLVLYQFEGKGTPGEFSRAVKTVIDPGAGAANMLIVRHEGQEYLMATNQAQGELVRYHVRRKA